MKIFIGWIVAVAVGAPKSESEYLSAWRPLRVASTMLTSILAPTVSWANSITIPSRVTSSPPSTPIRVNKLTSNNAVSVPS